MHEAKSFAVIRAVVMHQLQAVWHGLYGLHDAASAPRVQISPSAPSISQNSKMLMDCKFYQY